LESDDFKKWKERGRMIEKWILCIWLSRSSKIELGESRVWYFDDVNELEDSI